MEKQFANYVNNKETSTQQIYIAHTTQQQKTT